MVADSIHQAGVCGSHFWMKVRLSPIKDDVAIREFFCDLSPEHELPHTDYALFLQQGWSVQWSGNEKYGDLFDMLEDFDHYDEIRYIDE